jgi:hypothetical protein
LASFLSRSLCVFVICSLACAHVCLFSFGIEWKITAGMIRKETVIRGISEKGKYMLQPELASFLSRSPSFLIICSLACAPARVSVLFVNRIVNYSRNGQKGDCYKWNIGEREKHFTGGIDLLPAWLARSLSFFIICSLCVRGCVRPGARALCFLHSSLFPLFQCSVHVLWRNLGFFLFGFCSMRLQSVRRLK